jgi:hypothetical protein
MDINVRMTQHGSADMRHSSYEPLLFCLSFVLMAVWGIVVLIPIFFMAALADGFDRAWRYLRQPTRDPFGDEIPVLKHMDSQ